MLIQALNQYYDVLTEKNVFPEEGTSRIGIHYLIELDSCGNLQDIVNYQNKETIHLKNNKSKIVYVPRDIVLPKRTQKSAVEGNYIEHRAEYIFGLKYDKKTETFSVDSKRFNAFVKKNLDFIDGLHSPIIDAYRSFIENWDPKEELNNSVLNGLSDVKKQWRSIRFAFCLVDEEDNSTVILDYNIPEIKQRWKELEAKEKSEQAKKAIKMQCSVTGKVEPIARIHDKIKKIPGGNSTGNVLVGYNEEAFCSYGDSQSFNSKISEEVMKKYTASLNYLLDGNTHKKMLGDMTLVYWAVDGDELKETLIYDLLLDVEQVEDDSADAPMTTKLIHDLIEKSNQLDLSEKQLIDINIDPNVDFYIVGLKPNAARVSIKMIYRKRFGDIVKNIARFQRDIQIDDEFRTIPLWKIQKELVSPKASAESQKSYNPTLISKMLESIIVGGDMPIGLFERIITRVKTDNDLKINRVRAGIIKCYLNQKYRKKNQEEIGMSLNIQNENQAYLCGRLFAALQKTQEDTAKNKLNRTIKNAYFSSGVAQPAKVFPKLMMLYQHHLKRMGDRKDNQKIDWGKAAINREKLIQEIIGKLNGSFPMRLNLAEQGEFIIGYYQQYQDFFTAKSEKNV